MFVETKKIKISKLDFMLKKLRKLSKQRWRGSFIVWYLRDLIEYALWTSRKEMVFQTILTTESFIPEAPQEYYSSTFP